MRIFEDAEDEALLLSREDQEPLAKEPPISPWTELLSQAQKEALPLEKFPIIEDFEVVILPTPLWSLPWRKHWQYHFGFFSHQQGLLTRFGYLGHAEIDYLQENFHGPGDFWDREQAWEQVIFEKDEYVYVLEGDSDDYTSGYHCWFRVRNKRYLAEWRLAIEAFRHLVRQTERQ